ncbi:MAG: F0F1 ATP synthase subunit gamma, partial [Gemmatimonadota bacterium]|nr:F0F1 ATP synthase subunit gamma [Gemmatimonadota bacterium]
MAKGRELKGRIKSVENTRKITRTMEMVATSKLKRAQDRVVAARPYAAALAGVIADLYSPALAEEFPLLRQPEPVKRAAILLITSNRGLAGAFNANLIKEARKLLAQLQREGTEAELHITGRKGLGYFKYIGQAIESSRTDIGDRPTVENAAELVDDLMQGFIEGRLDALYLIYAKYVSPLSTPATTGRILPVEPPDKKETEGGAGGG